MKIIFLETFFYNERGKSKIAGNGVVLKDFHLLWHNKTQSLMNTIASNNDYKKIANIG